MIVAPGACGALRVGLALTYLSAESGGMGSYARELVPALLQAEPGIELTAFVSRDLPEAVTDAPWSEAVRWVRLPFSPSRPGPASAIASMSAQWAAIPALAARMRLDVVHGLANVVAPIAPRLATVVTLHDLIWLRHPTTMGLRGTLGMKLAAPRSARAADRVITGSSVARDDIVATLGLPAAKIDVVAHGVRIERHAKPAAAAHLRGRFDLGDAPLLLCVGQVRRHKNPAGLIRALALLADRRAQVVFAGSRSELEPELRALTAELGLADRIRFTGWVSDAELEGLYELASCAVLPSFDEGFGLPVLEAMGRGVPVACSNASSLPEVAGDAAVLFDPHDPHDIARSVERLLRSEQLRAELVARGGERCRAFTWEAAAAATLASYRRALAGRRRSCSRTWP